MKIPQNTTTMFLNKPVINSVGGGIGQPDPKKQDVQSKSLTLADDVVTLSVGGGIGQPDPNIVSPFVGGGIGQPEPNIVSPFVGGGIGQPEPLNTNDDTHEHISISV